MWQNINIFFRWLATLGLPKPESEWRKTFPHLLKCTCDRSLDTPQVRDVSLHILQELPMLRKVTNLEVRPVIYPHFSHASSTPIMVVKYQLVCKHCGVAVDCIPESASPKSDPLPQT